MEKENTTESEHNEPVDPQNRIDALEKRFDGYMELEEEHYEEYKYFEKRVTKFQENFPYERLNWLGRLIMWLICKKR